MCRICGVIDPAVQIEELTLSVKKMCHQLKNGGPDGEGIYISNSLNVVLGHRRLALLDLSEAGHQPMSYDNGRYQITYNGEIYNYPQLKKQLESLGYTFKTTCDTEMILVAFAAWGTACFEKFNGMFAFALLDTVDKKLFLVRDASGIKPLYYYTSGKKLYFASEVRALKSFPHFNQPDTTASVLFLAYGNLPEPYTTLSKVHMLPKGSFITFDIISGSISSAVFKKYQYAEIYDDPEEVKASIRSKLAEAVQRHLLSDAPIGVFLSGGIDSSLMALLAHKYTGNNLNTLSLYFNEPKYSEKKYQDLVIQAAECKHKQFLLDKTEYNNDFEQVISDMDLPGIDGINTWFISKYAKQSGLKAVLSGVGSDEIFGGYPSFRRMNRVKFLQKLPAKLLRSNEVFGAGKFKRIAYLSIPGAIGEYLFLRGQYIPVEIAQILNMDETEVWNTLQNTPGYIQNRALSLGNQASWMETNIYMQNQLLRDADVMSMAHGIEIRVPFLDSQFLEYSLKIKSDIKYQGALPKQLLIDSFKDILPEPIWNRPKMGFTFPFKDWMRNNEFVRSIINTNHQYKLIYQKFNSGKIHWSQLMSILVLDRKL